MIVFKGKKVFEGIAIGKIKIVEIPEKHISNEKVNDPNFEEKRFTEACIKAKKDLEDLYNSSVKEIGEEKAEIFTIHKMMIDDLDFNDMVKENINQGYNAEFAVSDAANNLALMFSSMDDEYMRARSVDILDVSSRITDVLCNIENPFILTSDQILLAKDINPSDLVSMDKKHILGIVTSLGSTSSHMAIIARSMSIPTVVDTNILFDNSYNDKIAIIDGFNSTIMLDPDQDVLKVYQERRTRLIQEEDERKALIGQENVTIDGKKIDIYCNIGKSSDVENAILNDADGIGLFRSEFLYLESTDYPSEDFQFEEYKKTLQKMQGKTVIIRTMDIGADKQAPYFNLPKEANPALGLRSVRICFKRPEIMHTQLRALYRASAFGKLKIMVPMITSVDEVKWVRNMAEEVKKELTKENISFDSSVEIGIMIETPAAAIISDDLAKVADFFSIGSNDLSQYTLAIDRQNQTLDDIFNPKHKAILRLIKMAVDNAHKEGIWCGICGELGRNFDLTEFFIKIGIDELSVSAPYVLKLREKVRKSNTKDLDLSKFI